jgi:hypothetical protein
LGAHFKGSSLEEEGKKFVITEHLPVMGVRSIECEQNPPSRSGVSEAHGYRNTDDIPKATFFPISVDISGWGKQVALNNKLLYTDARGQIVIIREIREMLFYLGMPVLPTI